MQLSEFFDYKNKLMEDLLTNEEIVKLVDDTVELSDAKTLAYTSVFLYEYIFDMVEEAKTFKPTVVFPDSTTNKLIK